MVVCAVCYADFLTGSMYSSGSKADAPGLYRSPVTAPNLIHILIHGKTIWEPGNHCLLAKAMRIKVAPNQYRHNILCVLLKGLWMSFDDIDLDRVVVDEDYRRQVIEFLNGNDNPANSDKPAVTDSALV